MIGTMISIKLDYGLSPVDLKITDSKGKTADEAMGWLVENVVWESEELERIMRHAVCLFAADAGTFGECLDQAIVWERG